LVALRSDPDWLQLQAQLRAHTPGKYRARPKDWPALKAYAWQIAWYAGWYLQAQGKKKHDAQVVANKAAQQKLADHGLAVDSATLRDWLR
jgi:hypothetical protein